MSVARLFKRAPILTTILIVIGILIGWYAAYLWHAERLTLLEERVRIVEGRAR